MKSKHNTPYHIRELTDIESVSWDAYVSYPVQSYAWIQSRKNLGILYVQLGIFKDNQLVSVALGLVTSVLLTAYKKISILKGDVYTAEIYDAFVVYGKKNHFAWYSFEPNVLEMTHTLMPNSLVKKNSQEFALWTTDIDTTQPMPVLEAQFSKVVRNESRYAIKNGLVTKNGTEEKLFEDFLQLMGSTKERNKFIGYSQTYYRSVFESLKQYNQVCLFVTYDVHENPVAAAFVFDFKDTLYYAYAGSLGRETPKGAMYLLVIAIIQYAHAKNKHTLDLFGCLDPHFNGEHPWKGFSQFKKAFNGNYKKYIGRYDLIVNPLWYRVYQCVHFVKKYMSLLKKIFS